MRKKAVCFCGKAEKELRDLSRDDPFFAFSIQNEILKIACRMQQRANGKT